MHPQVVVTLGAESGTMRVCSALAFATLALHSKSYGYWCRLPERIRPALCAFGGLADGFAPFHLPNGSTAELEMASVVMKAEQAHHPAVSPTSMPCAGKLGDDANMVKAQVIIEAHLLHP